MTAYKLEPLGQRVLVRLLPAKERSKLILTPLDKQTAREAQVIAVGPDCLDAEANQKILINSLVGQEVGDELIIPETAILGRVE